MNERDFDAEQERHRRRMLLMSEMGKVNRLERRMYILYALAGALAGLAIILGLAS